MAAARHAIALAALVSCCGNAAPRASWSPGQIAVLRHWLTAAPEDALPILPATDLDQASAAGDQAAIDRTAEALALRLARMHLLGRNAPDPKQDWHILDSDARIDLPARLAQALAEPSSGGQSGLDRFFADLRPRSPDYALLRTAYTTEKDPARRATLATNMDRWRWLPQSLGADYVLVNAAAFEVRLWRHGQQVGTWPVVVGKTKSPTPTFSAQVSGVTFNPWWDIPPAIVRESIGGMMRRHPALARQRGYIRTGASYRQKPGPANALGQMKLVMPNPFNVYLHDTPEKKLFARDTRAFSHGCIRVSDAIGFATTLVQDVKSADEVKAIIATGRTTTIDLPMHLPVYVTYFTATTRSDGTLAILPDIYKRDGTPDATAGHGEGCAG